MLQDKLSPSMMCASFFELAAQTATFEKNGGSYSIAVVQSEFFNIEYNTPHYTVYSCLFIT